MCACITADSMHMLLQNELPIYREKMCLDKALINGL